MKPSKSMTVANLTQPLPFYIVIEYEISMEMIIDRKKCLKCFGCVSVCPKMALEAGEEGPVWNKEKCIGCEACVKFCPVGALKLKKDKE